MSSIHKQRGCPSQYLVSSFPPEGRGGYRTVAEIIPFPSEPDNAGGESRLGWAPFLPGFFLLSLDGF